MPEVSDGLLYFIKYPFLALIYLFLLLTLRIMIGSLSLRSISKDYKNTAFDDKSDNSFEMAFEPTVVNQPIPEEISKAWPRSSHHEKNHAAGNAWNHNEAPVHAPEDDISVIPDESAENISPNVQAAKNYGYLELLSGLIAGNKKTIDVNGPISFGRSKEADVRIKDLFASAMNCEIIISPQGPVLKDLGSRNGTYCNDKRITGQVLLHDGDIFVVGEATFRWHKL
ncbi:MAG: FHA domain-containing protein [bacterium]|nr:FHA domain-containing protein [bacterium]